MDLALDYFIECAHLKLMISVDSSKQAYTCMCNAVTLTLGCSGSPPILTIAACTAVLKSREKASVNNTEAGGK